MKKKIKIMLVVGMLLVVTLVLCGCTKNERERRIFREEIIKVKYTGNFAHPDRFTVYFENGMELKRVVDKNILGIKKNRLVKIVFYSYGGLDWHIESYEYLEEIPTEKEMIYIETGLSGDVQFKIDFVDWFSNRFPVRYMFYKFRFIRS